MQLSIEYSLGLNKSSEKFSWNSFFPETLGKNVDWIWDKTRQISGQTDEYSSRKTIKQFYTQTNLTLSPGSDGKKNYCKSCWTNLGLKSQSKLNRHNDDCLVKISDQNTYGVRRSKSQTESEQNWFSENKTSWLYFPVSSFCDLFVYGHASLPGCKQHIKVLVWTFSTQYGPRIKLQNVWRNFASFGIVLVCTKFLKNSPKSEQNWFSEKQNVLNFLSRIFFFWIVCLWTCILTLVQTTYVIFFNVIRTQNKIAESIAKFCKFPWRIALVCKKFLKNSPKIFFFLKLQVKISTEFETKYDKFQVKQMSSHLGKKSNSFAHKRTFLSTLLVINKN